MKKLTAVLLALLLMLSFAASAESLSMTNEAAPAPWYELSADDTVLTVRLPGNTKTGLTWSFELSDSFALELITQETVTGESEGMAGTPTTYVASFMATAGAENTAALILRCADESAPDEPAAYTRILEISTGADNRLRVNSVLEQEPFSEWCEYSQDGYVLTVRLPGSGWTYTTAGVSTLELLTMEDGEAGYAASFHSSMDAAGTAELIFVSEDQNSYRTVTAFVNESGAIFVDRTETFDILNPARMAQCEICGGWFEEGNIFRNHICLMQSVEFRTVNITGNSVNVRSGAGTGYPVVTVLKKGANPRYLEETAQDGSGAPWHKISLDGQEAWVSGLYSKVGGSGYIRITGGNCNLRSRPSLDGEIITVLNQNAVVSYLGRGTTDARGTDWYQVRSGEYTGWISSLYSRFVASAVETGPEENPYRYAQISGGDCNLRKSPSLAAESLDVLKDGEYAEYLGEKATDERGVIWYKVSFGKRSGWISSKYSSLIKSLPAVQPASTEEPDDMRLVLNPDRYDIIRVSDIYSQNGRDYFITGCFGTLNAQGEPEYFDDRKTLTLQLTPGAEVLLPGNPEDPETIAYTEDPAIWFNEIRKTMGGEYSFYASFSMNESGEIRNLAYRVVY